MVCEFSDEMLMEHYFLAASSDIIADTEILALMAKIRE